jgi:hypothetical protein
MTLGAGERAAGDILPVGKPVTSGIINVSSATTLSLSLNPFCILSGLTPTMRHQKPLSE